MPPVAIFIGLRNHGKIFHATVNDRRIFAGEKWQCRIGAAKADEQISMNFLLLLAAAAFRNIFDPRHASDWSVSAWPKAQVSNGILSGLCFTAASVLWKRLKNAKYVGYRYLLT